ncbi:MAG TPA: hypothetical protein VGQ41_18330 [Pyrinomonadaceae bacterium]|jgi:hypothetical protein|nr:hypothetical protein [Pyrinomonadaceae bacterium]
MNTDLIKHLRNLWILLFLPLAIYSQTRPPGEYLWYEAENMRGFTTGKLGEPMLNPSHLNLPREKAPGWGINGPGVSAEWTQGGESEWNSAAASADESRATLYQDLEIPREGQYALWVRYADWAKRTENFTVTIAQNGAEVFRHEFGSKDVIDPHDEVSLYWSWAFAWDSAAATLKKGQARVSIVIEKTAEARRHVDCFLLTSDAGFKPSGRQKPEFAANRYLRNWSMARKPFSSLLKSEETARLPEAWVRPKVAGRDFLMPWNIAKEFWPLLDKPATDRLLFPFNAEPIEEFVAKYKGARDVPLFQSQLVVPVVHISNVPEYLKEGSPFLRYIRETKVPFAILINYGAATFNAADGQAAWQLLNGELKDQFLGWISGESVGYVWDSAPAELKISPAMSRRELLEAHRQFYSNAIARKWRDTFHTETGPMWDRLIPAQSTSSTSFAHALSQWGVNLLGMETAAIMPMWGMRIAFTRGAARQFGGSFLYYHAPNFGDTATTFTRQQNFAGPDYFYHSRYGPTMGPSLSWYRKSYYLYYMSGASAIYLEQGQDQFFKPGPGDHPFQLNPLGRITDEFVRFAEKHPNRGTPYTPVAFLLDPAHGFEMTDYPQWPFEVSQIDRGDRALRELFGVAYYPGLVVEGEPAIADRQPFVAGVFGDIFDVLTAADVGQSKSKVQTLLPSYRAVVVGGRIEWSDEWIQRLTEYARNGGTVILNAAQIKRLPEQFLGVRLLNDTGEAHNARCLAPGEEPQDLQSQIFRFERIELKGASPLITIPDSEPLVTVNKFGKGNVVFVAVPDLLGEDERMTPLAAHVLTHVFADAVPLKITGDVEYLINRTANSWVVTLLNNKGVFKPQQGMAQVDRSAYVDVTISGKQIQRAIEWTTDTSLKTANNSVTVQVPPGGLAIVEIF